MPNSSNPNSDAAATAPRGGPRQDRASADAGFPLGTVPRLPADAGFFLDIDGTLLDIAEKPQLVRIDEDLVGLLPTLRDAAGGALALISGRSIAEIDRLFGTSIFCAAGQHGAERRDFAGKTHRHRVPLAGIRKAQRQLAEELGEDFEMQAGKMVMEIKPSGKDKGTAIAEFLEEAPFRGRFPVFIGDDLTDEFGFELINRIGGCSVKVGEGGSAAHWRLPNADAVRAWLRRFLERSRENP